MFCWDFSLNRSHWKKINALKRTAKNCLMKSDECIFPFQSTSTILMKHIHVSAFPSCTLSSIACTHTHTLVLLCKPPLLFLKGKIFLLNSHTHTYTNHLYTSYIFKKWWNSWVGSWVKGRTYNKKILDYIHTHTYYQHLSTKCTLITC